MFGLADCLPKLEVITIFASLKKIIFIFQESIDVIGRWKGKLPVETI
jgi:hypothetical protein